MRLRITASAAIAAAVTLPATAQAAPQSETITSFAPYTISANQFSPHFCDAVFDVSWLPAVRRTVIAEIHDDSGNLRGSQIVPGQVDGAHAVHVAPLAGSPTVLTAQVYTWNDKKGAEGRLLATSTTMTLTPSSDCTGWTWTSTTPTG